MKPPDPSTPATVEPRDRKHRQLAGEEIPLVTWRPFLASLVVPVVLFLLANFAMSAFVERYPLNTTYIFMRQKWLGLLANRVDADFLILGDSSALHGINPEILDEKLGVRSTNLAMVGSLLSLNDAWMLGTYIDRHGPPEGVLITHVFDIWSRPLETTPLAKLPLPWGYWESPPTEYPLSALSVAKMGVIRYLPLSTDNQTVSRYLMYPWRRQFAELEERMQTTLRRGFWELPEGVSRAAVLRDAAEQMQHVRSRRPVISAPNVRALTAIGDLTERHGFDVYLALSPVYDDVARNPEFQDYWARTANGIAAITARYPRIHLFRDIQNVPIDGLTDTIDHVSAGTARAYTSELAEQILTTGRDAATLRISAGRAAAPEHVH